MQKWTLGIIASHSPEAKAILSSKFQAKANALQVKAISRSKKVASQRFQVSVKLSFFETNQN